MAFIDTENRATGESFSTHSSARLRRDLTQSEVRVTQIEGDQCYVEFNGLAHCAKVAASCHLQPQEGNLVLIASGSEKRMWVIAVLEQAAVGSGCIQLRAQRISLRSDELDVASQASNFVSVAARFSFGTCKSVGNFFSMIADRIMQHSQSYARSTEGHSHVEANNYEVKVKQTADIKAGYVLLEGEHLVKARGGQIHFG